MRFSQVDVAYTQVLQAQRTAQVAVRMAANPVTTGLRNAPLPTFDPETGGRDFGSGYRGYFAFDESALGGPDVLA